MTTQNRNPRQKRVVAYSLLAILAGSLLALILVTGGGGVGEVTAAPLNNSSYYDNQSNTTGIDAWMSGYENATLDNMTGMVLRVPTVIIGTGPSAPGGIGAAGPYILSVVIIGAVFGAVMGTNMGMVATGVLSVATLSGIVTAGIAPSWLFAVLLFGIGILAYRTLNSVLR